jgi:hypothetical protein
LLPTLSIFLYISSISTRNSSLQSLPNIPSTYYKHRTAS